MQGPQGEPCTCLMPSMAGSSCAHSTDACPPGAAEGGGEGGDPEGAEGAEAGAGGARQVDGLPGRHDPAGQSSSGIGCHDPTGQSGGL
jgi:hypothetical protein